SAQWLRLSSELILQIASVRCESKQSQDWIVRRGSWDRPPGSFHTAFALFDICPPEHSCGRCTQLPEVHSPQPWQGPVPSRSLCLGLPTISSRKRNSLRRNRVCHSRLRPQVVGRERVPPRSTSSLVGRGIRSVC